MAVGIVVGAVLGGRAEVLQPVGDLFIRLLVLAAVPLVCFNLLAGLAAHSGVRAFGRLAAKILAWFVATDLVALCAGMGAMMLLRPGAGMELTAPVDEAVGAVPSLADVLLDMIPVNLFQAFAEGNIVQVVVASLAIGVATLMLGGAARAPGWRRPTATWPTSSAAWWTWCWCWRRWGSARSWRSPPGATAPSCSAGWRAS